MGRREQLWRDAYPLVLVLVLAPALRSACGGGARARAGVVRLRERDELVNWQRMDAI